MLFMKFRTVAAALLAAGVVVIGAGVFARQHQEEGKAAPQAKAESPPEAKPNDPKEAKPTAAEEIRDLLREAALAAGGASDTEGKSTALLEIAQAQSYLGNSEDARATYQSAVRSLVASSVRMASVEFDALMSKIAQSQQGSGFNKEAIGTAKEIRDEQMRLQAITNIAESSLRAEDFEAAFQAAETFSNDDKKTRLLERIAAVQANAAGPQAVRPWVEKASSPLAKSRLLLGIANGVRQRELKKEGISIQPRRADPGPEGSEGSGKGKK